MRERRAAGAGRISIFRVPISPHARRQSPRVTAAQALGYDASARLVIINADDFGLCREANHATIDALRSGAVSSASVMVPAPGFPEAASFARAHPEADIGVHLVLTSEWNRHNKWGPVLGREAVPSLVDRQGYLWPCPARLFARGEPGEAEAELRAQIAKARAAGVDVSHIDSHMFTLHGWHAAYRDIYLRIACDYRLPIRAASRGLLVPVTWRSILGNYTMPARALRRTLLLRTGFASITQYAARLGMVVPDYVIVRGLAEGMESEACWSAVIASLPPGLTEIYCHPAHTSAELRSYAEDAAEREADSRFFGSSAARSLLAAANVKLVGHRLLREAMQSAPAGYLADWLT